MTWAIDNTSMDAWATANTSNKGPAFLWWEKAELLGDALAAWWTEWYNDIATPVTNGTQKGAVQMTAGGANIDTSLSAEYACNVDGGAAWTDGAGTDNDSASACGAACFGKTAAALLVNPDTTNPTVANGGLTAPSYTGAGTGWCGAWSFNGVPANHHSSGAKCKFLLNQQWDTADTNGASIAAESTNGDATSNANDACAKAEYTKAWSTKQLAVKGAWDALIATNEVLHTNMVAAANVQAGLEKNWLEAWYNQAYWGAIVLELTCTAQANDNNGNAVPDVCTAGSKAKTYYDGMSTLDGADGGDNTTVAGADAIKTTSENDLNTAEEALAKLQATTAEAAATVAALGKRILNADAQIAELTTLTTSGALATAAAVRKTEWDDYKNDGSVQDSVKGEFTNAAEEKVAADLAVKARSDA